MTRRDFGMAHAIERSDIDSTGERFSSNEDGVALLEFALIFPILLAVLITVYEFANLLFVKEAMSFIARESAMYAFRDCSPYEDQAAADSCVAQVQGQLLALATQTFAPSRSRANENDLLLHITVFRWNGGPEIFVETDPALAAAFSRSDEFLTDPDLRQLIEEHERIAMSEVNFQYRPKLLDNLAFIRFSEFDFYEMSAY